MDRACIQQALISAGVHHWRSSMASRARSTHSRPLRILLCTPCCGPRVGSALSSSACPTHCLVARVSWPEGSRERVPSQDRKAPPLFCRIFFSYLQMFHFLEPLKKTESDMKIIPFTTLVVCVLLKHSSTEIRSHDHNMSSTQSRALPDSSGVPPLKNA